ncbi:hypothetical protein GCM10010466_62470 [Planomonospora alba]|uniref:Uncharacterized protein n=1 Tax=Planomonospora alba TaxID=161354 RepID=A0ABP6NZH5_9ACTN
MTEERGRTTAPHGARGERSPAETALRTLRARLLELHRGDGMPGMWEIARRIGASFGPSSGAEDGPETVASVAGQAEALGPATVHTVLHCRILPAWWQVERVVRALGGRTEPVLPLWEAAYAASPERAAADAPYRQVGGDPLTGRGDRPPEAALWLWDPAIGGFRMPSGWRVPDSTGGYEYLPGGHLGHRGTVHAMAYSPDGDLLATSDERGEVRLWDPATGEPAAAPLTGHGRFVTRLVFHPHGRVLAAGGGTQVRLWDLDGGEPLGGPLLLDGGVAEIAFHPDGRLLAAVDERGEVRLWDPATGEPAAAPFTCHAGRTWAVAFHPGGGLLATAGSDDGDGTGATVRLWDLDGGEPVTRALAEPAGPILHAVFDPGVGRLAAAVADTEDGRGPLRRRARTVWLWDLDGGEPAAEPFSSPSEDVRALAFHPDGRLLAVGGGHSRYPGRRMQLWDPGTGSYRIVHNGAHDRPDDVEVLAFHPGGGALATGGDAGVQLWTTLAPPVGSPLVHRAEDVHSVVFHPAGDLLATVSREGTARFWDPATGEPAAVPPLSGGKVVEVAFHPDGRLLAEADGEGTVRLRDAVTGEPAGAPLPEHSPDPFIRIAFDPGGRLLATTDFTLTYYDTHYDSVVWLWDPFTGRLLDCLHTEHRIEAMAFHPGGGLLAVAAGGAVQLWDPATGEPAGAPLPGSPHASVPVKSLAFHPGGGLLASTTGSAGSGVRLWDPSTGERVGGTFGAQERTGISAMGFHPAGDLLATGYSDGTVRLWDPFTGEPVGTPMAGHFCGVNALAFQPGGDLLATAGDDGTARLWCRRRPG